ncbi:MAG: DnaD domain protein [Lachnospiraceae bacterium]|nr:DnaD domain protein [Lachnospiraceae bacterium]
MKTITISTENSETYSSISNFFIDYYMTDANGEFVKIYLYLVRLLQHGNPVTVAQIADHFNLTENDICRAIRYWISRDVLRFKYDDNKRLSGIVLLPLHAPATDMDLGIDAVTLLKSDASDLEDNTKNEVIYAEKNILDNNATNGNIKAPVSQTKQVPDVPVFTKKAIEAKLRDEEWEDLTFQLETYFARPLSNNEINSLMYIHDSLGFSVDLMEYLFEYCLTLGKKSVKYAQAVAIEWYKDDIKNRQTAKENYTATNGMIKLVYKELGINNRTCPTQAELAFVKTWSNDYAMTPELIQLACQKAILSKPNSANFKYVNGIIESWHKNNVKTLSDVDELDKTFVAKINAKTNSTKQPSNVSSFNNFKQTKLDAQLDEMEELLLNEVNR